MLSVSGFIRKLELGRPNQTEPVTLPAEGQVREGDMSGGASRYAHLDLCAV